MTTIDLENCTEYHEAKELSRQIMRREKLAHEDSALAEALSVRMFRELHRIRDDRSFSEQFDEISSEVHPREIRDLLQLRLADPAAYYAKPGARRIATDRSNLLRMAELLPRDLPDRPHAEQDAIIRDVTEKHFKRPEPMGRPMTGAERVIWKRCVRLGRKLDPEQPEVEVFGTMTVLALEHELDGTTDVIPLRDVLRALKQRLKHPEKFQRRIERTRPLADLYFAEDIARA